MKKRAILIKELGNRMVIQGLAHYPLPHLTDGQEWHYLFTEEVPLPGLHVVEVMTLKEVGAICRAAYGHPLTQEHKRRLKGRVFRWRSNEENSAGQ